MDYNTFLERKKVTDPETGIEVDISSINTMLYDFQKDIVRWALRRGRSAIFADCGLGKTPMQLEWAHHVPGPVLILAPLAVSTQTVHEGEKFGIDVGIASKQSDVTKKISITNYEKLGHFDPSYFTGVVLDESSILKSHTGKYRTQIIESFSQTPFRLACTATPAPNDFMELGNHAEFLGTMTRSEMLAMFFIHDGGETSKWRLKGHAKGNGSSSPFWEWLCSWAVMIRRPSDLGYNDDGFILPEMHLHEDSVETNKKLPGELFTIEARTLSDRIKARRETVDDRAKVCADMINASDETWIVWCNLNKEAEAVRALVPDAVEIRGSDKAEFKESAMMDFSAGKIRVLITKPSIAGFGMNWQHCSNVAFVGLSDSYEQFYQAVRRCWRFGQKREVNVHIITADIEGAVVKNIARKEEDSIRMAEEMLLHMKELNTEAVHGSTKRNKASYNRQYEQGDGWTLHLGDCVDVASDIEDNSIGYCVYSPPFASLYTYSNSDRDMGNSRDMEEFMTHYRFLVDEMYRIMKPGRLVSFHCMNLPSVKERDGYIGIKDFRGDLIRLHQQAGFIYHSEVVIWKNPVTAMQRTKALGLLHKTIRKDSAMSRQGIPDYVVTMRKPGENPEPISHTHENFPVSLWQNYASPVWMDINPSDTLQYRAARDNEDERHIAPLQLEVIRRCLELWSKEGDLVFSPFTGIGSEGYCSLQMDRNFIGSELKESYFRLAIKNLKAAKSKQPTLFS